MELGFSCLSYSTAEDYRHTAAGSSRKCCRLDFWVFSEKDKTLGGLLENVNDLKSVHFIVYVFP